MPRKRIIKKITTKEFDEKFENEENISRYLDIKKVKRQVARGQTKPLEEIRASLKLV